MRPTPVTPTSASGTQLSQASKENTPMPDSVPRAVKVPTASSTTESIQETRALAESFNMTLRYMDEYIDENPLLGEPGSFILSSAHGSSSQTKTASQPKSTTPAKSADSEMTEPQTDGDGANAAAKKTTKSGEKSSASPGIPPKPKRRKSKAAGVTGGGVTPT